MKRLVGDVAAGAVAGAAATVPMTAVMWAAQQAGLIHKQPPEQITESALHAAGADPPPEEVDQLSAVSHVLFGAAAGGVFGAVCRVAPAGASTAIAGSAYGLLVWFASYQGWVPSLNIMPPADKDQPGRPESMAAAHVVYGAALASVLRSLRPTSTGGTT